VVGLGNKITNKTMQITVFASENKLTKENKHFLIFQMHKMIFVDIELFNQIDVKNNTHY